MRKGIRVVKFEIPKDVDPGSEIEGLYIIWDLLVMMPQVQGQRMLRWASEKLAARPDPPPPPSP